MAFQLKTTGLGPKCVMCIAVDEDGTTIKDFASALVTSTMTTTGVTVGTGSWKGTSRKYFDVNPAYIAFGANKPARSDPLTAFAAAHEVTQKGYYGALLGASSQAYFGHLAWLRQGLVGGGGNNLSESPTVVDAAYPTGKHSFAASYHTVSGGLTYQGPESGATTNVGNNNTPGYGFTINPAYIGLSQQASDQFLKGKYYVVAMFNQVLTQAEQEALHADPVGALLETSAPSTAASFTITSADATFSGSAKVSPLASFILTAQASTFSGSAATGASSASFALSIDSAIFAGGAVGDTSVGTILTPALKNNTGTPLANETGVTAYVYNPTTGDLIVKKTSQTTNGSGVLSIIDALIVAGTQYRLVIVLGSGAEGMDKVTAT